MENQKVNAIELKNNLLFVVPSKTIREVLTDINDYDEGDGIGSAKSLRTELFRESGMKGVVVEVLKLVLINAALFILFQILKYHFLY